MPIAPFRRPIFFFPNFSIDYYLQNLNAKNMQGFKHTRATRMISSNKYGLVYDAKCLFD